MTTRIKELKKLDDEVYADELEVLEHYLLLKQSESKAEKKIKAAHAELDKKLLQKYGLLTETKKVELAIKKALEEDDPRLAELLDLVMNQHEY